MHFNPANLIVALDEENPWRAQSVASDLLSTGCSFKLGMEVLAGAAYQRLRPDEILKNRLAGTMRDGKYWDIPNTVVGAVRVDSKNLGPRFTTIPLPFNHLSFKAAVEWAAENDPNLTILGVTVLTCMDDVDVAVDTDGHFKTAADALIHYAKLALKMALGHPIGLVCSPKDLPRLTEEHLLDKFAAIVAPGIRPVGAARGDQKRVGTPASALLAGATHLVIGRPITGAPDPLAALKAILAEIAAA